MATRFLLSAGVAKRDQPDIAEIRQTVGPHPGRSTKLVTSGATPTAWVMNHGDLEAIDLTCEDGASGGFMEGIDDKILGRLLKIGSSVVPASAAYLGDWNPPGCTSAKPVVSTPTCPGCCSRKTRSSCGMRARYGFAVLRPSAYVQIDLTA